MGNSITHMLNRSAPLACALLLGAIAVMGRAVATDGSGVEDYMLSVQRAVDAVPYRIGPWIGEDLPTPPAAVSLLKPNKILQRLYVDPSTGRAFTLLVVHCGDTRDMVGHYPPICYPAHGWQQGLTRTVTFQERGRVSPAMNYEFSRFIQGAERAMKVFSFFVLPDGRVVGDMATLTTLSGHRKMRQLGAAQVQIVGGESISEDERMKIIHEFIRATEPVIRVIAEGEGNG